jgi:peptidoglycan/LPS O-acetylase OafA/YrhL
MIDSKTDKSRDLRIDVLKVIGLLSIILAHIKINDFMFNVRNFDVPLMVLCSGVLFCHSMGARKNEIPYLVYIKQRVLRLLAPSWAFLLIYFVLVYFFCLITKELYPYTWTDMLQEFFLRSKIIGLWIIRVFILVAVLAPVLYKLRMRLASNFQFMIMLLISYVIYESLYYGLSVCGSGLSLKIMEKSLFEMIPYACVFGLGMSLASENRSSILITAISLFAVFIILFGLYSYLGMPASTQEYKYPPRLYYLSYGVVVSLSLYLLLDAIKIGNSFVIGVIYFVSSSSLWIYLWHFFFLKYSIFIVPYSLRNSSFVQYIAVLSLSIMLTFFQKIIITKLIDSPRVKEGRCARMLSLVFLK